MTRAGCHFSLFIVSLHETYPVPLLGPASKGGPTQSPPLSSTCPPPAGSQGEQEERVYAPTASLGSPGFPPPCFPSPLPGWAALRFHPPRRSESRSSWLGSPLAARDAYLRFVDARLGFPGAPGAGDDAGSVWCQEAELQERGPHLKWRMEGRNGTGNAVPAVSIPGLPAITEGVPALCLLDSSIEGAELLPFPWILVRFCSSPTSAPHSSAPCKAADSASWIFL